MKTKVLGYISERGTITEEEAKKVTHLNIAFGRVFSDGSVDGGEHDKVKMIPQIRSWNPSCKICLSYIDGDRKAFSTCAADEGLRRKVAANMAALVRQCDLDGIDLDWEYPCVPSNGTLASPADKENFTFFCQEIRKALDAEFGTSEDSRKLLTIAAGADVYYIDCVEVAKLAGILDYICVMTYDLKCGFHALTGHHTALYTSRGDYFMNSCDRAMKLFVDAGFPKERLLLGAGFYSRKWENVPDVNHGFLQLTRTGGGYGPGFTVLDNEYINKNGYVRYWDEEAKAPWLFNGSTFITYDDEESLRYKSRYVLDEGYGGIFYWEHGSDPSGKLLEAIYEVVR